MDSCGWVGPITGGTACRLLRRDLQTRDAAIVANLHGEIHRPAAHLAVHGECGAAFRHVKGEREGFAAMRALDGQGFVHAASRAQSNG